MPHSRPLQSVLQVLIGTIVLALIVRTWLVMGIIAPVNVAGSSMAPTLRGEHLRVDCPQCAMQFSVGAEFTLQLSKFNCPFCGKHEISLERRLVQSGDALVVDRQAIVWQTLQRGDLVVLRNPDDARQLCVKRIWGLPEERIEIRSGDLLVDGMSLDQPLELQRIMRQLVHRESEHSQRWHPEPESSVKWQQQSWHVGSRDSPLTHWLRYQHPGDQAIYDDVAYNADLTRRLYPVRDVMLSAEVRLQGKGWLHLSTDDGRHRSQIDVNVGNGKVVAQITESDALVTSIPSRLLDRVQSQWVTIELSNFDRMLLLSIDSQVVVQARLPSELPPLGTGSPFAIGVRHLGASVRQLELYRDVYFTPQTIGLPPSANSVFKLGPQEYFLLGDNSPVSLDSRSWGPVPERLFVGRPLGIR